MTQNQLRYWELRWKQHYESILAKVKVAELEETKRHNRAEERIDTQNMIINRGNLAARWAELEEKQRAALVAEALNQKKYELEAQKVLSQINVDKANIKKMLTEAQVAVVDMAISASEVQTKNAQAWLREYANALKAGWGEAAVAKFASVIESSVSNSPITTAMKGFAENNPEYAWIGEVFGPAVSSEILRVNSTSESSQSANTQQPLRQSQYQRNKAKMASAPGAFDDENGPGISKPEPIYDAPIGPSLPATLPQSNVNSNYTHNNSYSVEKKNASINANTPITIGGPTSTNSSTQSKSNVIYSPGIKVGPGW